MDIQERASEFIARTRRTEAATDFLRYAWSVAKHPRDRLAAQAAAAQFRSKKLDAVFQKTAVSLGNAHDATWASELADFYELSQGWVATTSRRTFLGRLPFRRVPFATRTLTTGAPTASFVASGKAIPLQGLNLTDSTTLMRTKVATIAAVTNESLEVWQAGTRENLDAVLSLALVRGMDLAALDPDQALVAGERPAGLLNAVDPLGALGSDVATVLSQVKAMLQVLTDGGSDLDGAVFAMHPTEALALSTLTTAEGVPAFPQLGATGGFILGVPAVTSVGAVRSGSPDERVFAVIDGGQVIVADDNEIAIDTSRVAAVQMDSAPTMDGTGSTTPTNVTSAFQTHTTLLKLVRYVNWERLATSAVAWLTVAA